MSRVLQSILESHFWQQIKEIVLPAKTVSPDCSNFADVSQFDDDQVKLFLYPPEFEPERSWFVRDLSCWIACQSSDQQERLLSLAYQVDSLLGLSVLAGMKPLLDQNHFSRLQPLEDWHASKQNFFSTKAEIPFSMTSASDASVGLKAAITQPGFKAAFKKGYEKAMTNRSILLEHFVYTGVVSLPAVYCLMGACHFILTDSGSTPATDSASSGTSDRIYSGHELLLENTRKSVSPRPLGVHPDLQGFIYYPDLKRVIFELDRDSFMKGYQLIQDDSVAIELADEERKLFLERARYYANHIEITHRTGLTTVYLD